MLKSITDAQSKTVLAFNFGIADHQVSLEFIDPNSGAVVSAVVVKAEGGKVNVKITAGGVAVHEGPLFVYERTSSGSNRRKNGTVNAK
jgi:hypothetical protein